MVSCLNVEILQIFILLPQFYTITHHFNLVYMWCILTLLNINFSIKYTLYIYHIVLSYLKYAFFLTQLCYFPVCMCSTVFLILPNLWWKGKGKTPWRQKINVFVYIDSLNAYVVKSNSRNRIKFCIETSENIKRCIGIIGTVYALCWCNLVALGPLMFWKGT